MGQEFESLQARHFKDIIVFAMFEVAALYKFSKILDPFKTHNSIRSKLKNFSVYGTILVGEEGLNGTISAANKRRIYQML